MADISSLVHKYRPDLTPYEELYKHYHANPELSNQENETAAHIVGELQRISPDFDIRPNIGGHGIAALLFNGHGPTVLLRADMDALPIEERTDLPYASRKRMKDAAGILQPVMHACGHDMHITCLLAAAHTLVSARDHWSGTLLLVFQPAEERGTGAQAMLDDGLYDPQRHNVPLPDVCLGGHVVPWRTGTLGTKRGLIATAADSLRITLHGRGGHASMPHHLIDPITMAASSILKLQTIISREIPPGEEPVVLTVSSIQAGQGSAENILPDNAHLSLDLRSASPKTRSHLLSSIHRILHAESQASNATHPPTITHTRTFPPTINLPPTIDTLEKAYHAHFPTPNNPPHQTSPSIPQRKTYNPACPRMCGSEDFSLLGSSVSRPTLFFLYGGISHEVWDSAESKGKVLEEVEINHSARFVLEVRETLRVGMEGYVVGALGLFMEMGGGARR